MSLALSTGIFAALVFVILVWTGVRWATAQDFSPPSVERTAMVTGVLKPPRSSIARQGYRLLLDFDEPSPHDERDHLIITVPKHVWDEAAIGDRWVIGKHTAIRLED